MIVAAESLDGRRTVGYPGAVSGEAFTGANIFRAIFARIRDTVGGRPNAYETETKEAKRTALDETTAWAMKPGADAGMTVNPDYEVIGGGRRTMPMMSANGKAARLSGAARSGR